MTSNPPSLRKAWEKIHQGKPTSEQPAPEVLTFVESLSGQFAREVPWLDLGCGRGRNSHYLSRLGLNAYGCDISMNAVRIAQICAQKERLLERFHQADVTDLPYPAGVFAAAICYHVLPYLPVAAMQNGLAEIARVLRPGGWLYVDLLDCQDADFGCGPAIEAHTFLDLDGVPVHFVSLEEIEALLYPFKIQHQERFERGRPKRRRIGWIIWARKL